jgi:galactokinase
VSAAISGSAFAPGRVNLIGEHTDYNDGFVLPMPLTLGVTVAFAAREDRVLRVSSRESGEQCEARLDALDRLPRDSWFAYVAGVAHALRAAGHDLCGADLTIESTLPMGVGLSSSAALEVAVARALLASSGIEVGAVEVARLCQRAENDFVGVPCGIMDQMAASVTGEGEALLIDCRSLDVRRVRMPGGASIVVMESMETRKLTTSAYADRRAACERVVDVLRAGDPRIAALRDVGIAQLERATGLTAEDLRRARHVVEENARVLEFVAALEAGDLAGAGALIDASHESLRTLFEVSSPALDALVGRARQERGCHGARLTGAGFGGCAIALVERAKAGGFIAAMRSARGEDGRPLARRVFHSLSA